MKEGISGKVDNFCLNATNMNSVFVKFTVSLLADSHVYTLFNSLSRQSLVCFKSTLAKVRLVSFAYILGCENTENLADH